MAARSTGGCRSFSETYSEKIDYTKRVTLDIFCRKSVIGMIHLQPLPGSPRFRDTESVVDCALRDYVSLKEGGVDGILVENYGDLPYLKERVEPQTVTWMTKVILSLGIDLPFGVNVLRNDAVSALAIAHAAGGVFIRCNVLSGVMVTDQGIIEGKAAEVLRYRSALKADIQIFADVCVKHAAPLRSQPLEEAA